MKKYSFLIFCLLLLLSLFGCVASGFRVDYGRSSVYTRADMDEAIETVKKEFRAFEGCVLYSLSYSSDDVCNTPDNVAWMNKLGQANGAEETFTQCIMFESSFRSPITGGGGWEPNREYTWSWWLARSDGGEWKLMTYGYG